VEIEQLDFMFIVPARDDADLGPVAPAKLKKVPLKSGDNRQLAKNALHQRHLSGQASLIVA